MTTFNRRHALSLIGGAAVLPALGTPVFANTKLNVGALRFTSHAASFVAFERGYFADEGLDVSFRFFQAAQPMAVAIASGDVDFGVTAITGGLISLAEKGAAKVIGGALSEEPGINGQKILASLKAYEDGAAVPGDLNGRTFGITQAGSSFHYMGAKVAATENIFLHYKPLQKVGAIIGALKSGQIDAWAIVPHIALALAGANKVKIIGDIVDYLPHYQVTTVFTQARIAANERAKTEAFLRAFSHGAADYNAALVDKTAEPVAAEEMIKLIHKYVYADRPLEKAAKSIRNGAMRINQGAALNMASVKDQLNWFKSEGLVKPSITPDTLVDTSYVKIIE